MPKKMKIWIILLIVFAIVWPRSVKLLIAEFNGMSPSEDNSAFPQAEFIDLLDGIIAAEQARGLTGIQLAVYKDGELIKNSAYGYLNNYYTYTDAYGARILDKAKVLPEAERDPTEVTDLFDWASNTKMFATTYALQRLVSQGQLIPDSGEALKLDTKISEVFPEFLDEGNDEGWKDEVTLSQVLSHHSGFADKSFHNDAFVTEEFFSQDKERTKEIIMSMPLAAEPGTRYLYTDVDMMLAGLIVEELTGQRLDEYLETEIYGPLGLDRLVFNPEEHGFQSDEVAASEIHGNTRDGRYIYENVRMDVVQGAVHDEKAYYSMHGVSGHAGLMGPAAQVAYLGQAMYSSGVISDVDLFDEETIAAFKELSPLQANQALGGWRIQGDGDEGSYWAFSDLAPVGTVGHTGWTGTFTMIDPVNKISLALATNSRNAPIMERDIDSFYTKNFNVDSYEVVSELIYRGLGLADDDIKTPTDFLLSYVESELPILEIEDDEKEEADAEVVALQPSGELTPSKRNVLRVGLSLVEAYSADASELEDFLAREEIINLQDELGSWEAQDMNFLLVTKELDIQLATLTEQLRQDLVVSSDDNAKRELEFLSEQATRLLANANTTQYEIDTLAEEIATVLEGLDG